ncbi:MAG TPA: hypothetical protein VHM70_24775, partial [Polyangiaceae bacterium]|nr:hypothetical protein [Polyangiaceae bacterium]
MRFSSSSHVPARAGQLRSPATGGLCITGWVAGALLTLGLVACTSEQRDFSKGTDAGLHQGDETHDASGGGTKPTSMGDGSVAADGGANGPVTPGPHPSTSEDDSGTKPAPHPGPSTKPSPHPAPEGDAGTGPVTSDTDAATSMGDDSSSTSDDAGYSEPACKSDANCDDLNPCNGIESCEDGQCVAGTWADNGSACDLQTDAAKRVCSNGNCILSFCGDG